MTPSPPALTITAAAAPAAIAMFGSSAHALGAGRGLP
jgi:hypothetical protein